MVLLVVLPVVSACVDGSPGSTSTSVLADVEVSTSAASTTVPELTVLPFTTTSSSTTTTTTTPVATDADLSLVEAFVDFAKHVDDETFSWLPLADSVMLGLGPETMNTFLSSDLRNSEAWVLELEAFRAYVGPFSALELLDRLDDYQVNIGPHPHCVPPSQPAPIGLEDHRRVSVQPKIESIDSCLQWFTVNLFVATTGLIEAITLDLWEP